MTPGGTFERAAIGIYERAGYQSLLVSAGNTLTTMLGSGLQGYVYSGGVLISPIITSGGEAFVDRGGTAVDAMVESGGVLDIYGEVGTAPHAGLAIDPQIFAGGFLRLGSGGIVSGAVVHSGADAAGDGYHDTTVLAGGLLSIDDDGWRHGDRAACGC